MASKTAEIILHRLKYRRITENNHKLCGSSVSIQSIPFSKHAKKFS